MEPENQDEARQQARRRLALRSAEQSMRLMLSRFGSGDATFIEPVNVGDPVPRSTPEDREVDSKIADAMTSVVIQPGSEAFPGGLDSLDAQRTEEVATLGEIENIVTANADVPDSQGPSLSLVSINDTSAMNTPPPAAGVQDESIVLGADTPAGIPVAPADPSSMDALFAPSPIDFGDPIDVTSTPDDEPPVEGVSVEFSTDADLAPNVDVAQKLELPPIFDGDYKQKMQALATPMKPPGVGTKTNRTPIERMQQVRDAKAAADEKFDASLRDTPQPRAGGRMADDAETPAMDFGNTGTTFATPMNASQVSSVGAMESASEAIDSFGEAFVLWLNRITTIVARHEERLSDINDRLETEDPFDGF